jgi:SAM-dependent methyltransferase
VAGTPPSKPAHVTDRGLAGRIDASAPALAKARALAAERGVPVASAPFVDDHRPGTIAIEQANLLAWPWPEARYGAVVAVFIQFAAPTEREALFAGMARTLAPGGVLLLEGYGPRQLEYGTGGPRALENLYTPELLRGAFPTLETALLEEEDREVHEGPGHDGMSALIHFAAVAPAAPPSRGT